MVIILYFYYLDDRIISSYFIFNVWNYLFLMVNWIVLFWVDCIVYFVWDILGINLYVVYIYFWFLKFGCCGVNFVILIMNDFDGMFWCMMLGSC